MKEATVYVDAVRVAAWLHGAVSPTDPLGERIQARALALVEHLAQAVAGFDVDEDLLRADRALCALRALLQVARESRALDDRRLLHVARELDVIGRQLGGWQRSRAPDSDEERHR